MKPIIKVEGLSKQYRLGTIGAGTLQHDFKRWIHRIQGKEDPFLKIGDTNDRSTQGSSEYVWALRDINFEVAPGEILGIIGKNGSGKSTLLKILSNVTGPTTGRVNYDGRIASLLEVGTGFHPELTGRENIFLNGAILGMSKQEIRSKLDEIIDFSGCERYIDTPVKRYSSGMMVRLGFAVAAHLEPDILVVDEVLAVGDAEFQNKAINKMQDVSKGEGRTILFVSHNMDAIRRLCNRGLLLQNGTIEYSGNIIDTLEHYIIRNDNASKKIYNKNVTDSIYLEEAVFYGDKDIPKHELFINESWKIKIRFGVTEVTQDTIFAIGLISSSELPINTTWSQPENFKPGNYEIEFVSDKVFFQKGVYKVVFGISKGKESLFYDEKFLQFEVLLVSKELNQNIISVDGSTGIILNQLQMKINQL